MHCHPAGASFDRTDPQPALPLQAAAPAERRLFSTRKFAAQHGLGDPVAVTWFNSHK